MWIIGAAIHLPGSALVVLGENMIKKGNAIATAHSIPPWRSKPWWRGFAVFVVGNASHFIAFMFVSVSQPHILPDGGTYRRPSRY